MKHQNKSLSQLSLGTLVVLLLFCTINTTPAQTVPEIAEKALAATVYLEMQDSNGKTLGFGSGFFIREDLIATNYHVIEGAAQGTAKLVGKSTKYNIEGVTALDEQNDLVILKVTAYGVTPLSLGKSDIVQIGETVYVAGNPKGLEGTFSDGIISSKRGGYSKERLQMTAPISPGSSGGPVLNNKGEVVGVSVSVYKALDAQNLNFAIPSRYLKVLITQSSMRKSVQPLEEKKQQLISVDTHFKRGNQFYSLALYEKAIVEFDKVLQAKPDFAEAYYNRANAKSYLKRPLAALRDYNEAISLKPDFAEAYYGRGLVMNDDLEDYYAAKADFDRAIQLKPNFARAYATRGAVKYGLGRRWEGRSDIRTALKLAKNAGDEKLVASIEDILREIDGPAKTYFLVCVIIAGLVVLAYLAE